jgi:hypothetical protein
VNRSLNKKAKLEILVLLLAILSIVAALDWALRIRRPEVRFTEQQAEQIYLRGWKTRTITRNEVVALLGVPEGDYRSDRSQPLNLISPKSNYLLFHHGLWISDHGYILVTWNVRTRRVIQVTFGRPEKPPSLRERFDAWFLWLLQKVGL